MTLLRKDSILSVLVVGILLVGSTFAFLPAFAANTASATGSSPAALSGVTTAIDSSIAAGFNVSVIRTITLTNPIGNPAIDSLTISVPKAAVGVAQGTTSTCPITANTALTVGANYTTPCGGVPTGSGIPGSVSVTADTYGAGPWAVVYSSSGILVPGGAAVNLQLGFVTEVNSVAAGTADSYSLSVSATDSSGATTTLPSIPVFEGNASVTITTPSVANVTAGATFSVTAKAATGGLPLVVTTNGTTTTTTLTPATFSSSTAGTSITVNDTTAENITVTVANPTLATTSSGGTMNATSGVVIIVPGAIAKLAVVVSGITDNPSTNTLNITTSVGLQEIPAANITVSTADKFDNAVKSPGTTTLTLAATTLSGQPAGFSNNSLSANYPYTPSGGVLAGVTLTIPAGKTNVSSNSNYVFGVDYGSQSVLIATASGSGLASGTSATIVTYTLSATPITVNPTTNVNVIAGKTITVSATFNGVVQKNVPITLGLYAGGTTYAGSYSSTGTNMTTVATAITGTGASAVANASTTLVVSTTAGDTVQVTGNETMTPTTYASALVTSSGIITTTSNTFASLTVKAFFVSSPGVFEGPTTHTVAGGVLNLNISAADAYGNPVAVTGDTQLILTASAGSLSITSPVILSGAVSTADSGVIIQYVAPSTVGTTATLSASGISSGVSATGSTTVTVVSGAPLLSATGPTTLTSGVPSTVTGIANASNGVFANKIMSITYSVNGGTSNGVGITQAANVSFAFTILLSGPSNINITATDSAGKSISVQVQIPPIPTSSSFTFASAPSQVSLSSAIPVAINTTVVNAQATSISAVIVAVLSNSGGQQGTFTSAVTVAAGSNATALVTIFGLASGTYTATVSVVSTSGVPLSASTTATVTVS